MIGCKDKKPLLRLHLKICFQYNMHVTIVLISKRKLQYFCNILKYLFEKETDKIFKCQNFYKIILYKMKLIKDQNIYTGIVILDLLEYDYQKNAFGKLVRILHTNFCKNTAWLSAYYIHKLLFQVINQRICWRLKR